MSEKQLDLFEIHKKWYIDVMRGEGVRRLPYCKCNHCKSEIFKDGRVPYRKSCPICNYRGVN